MQLLFLLNLACTVPGPSYSGHGTYSYLAFDGERSWKYENESTDYNLVVEKTAYNITDGIETITFEYSKEDPQELLGSVTWISGITDGIGIQSYDTGDGEIELDNPVIFAKTRMVPGEVVSSSANGFNFESVLNGVETCPNSWNTAEEDWECLYFTLSADQDGHGFPFVGDFWMANGWGPSRFMTTEGPWATDTEWVLLGASWSDSE